VTREPRLFAVLGFGSTHDALDAESLLVDLGIEVTPIPAPRTVGAHCGIALRLALADEDRAVAYLAAASIEVAARVHIEDV
jgi:hypothetical protein